MHKLLVIIVFLFFTFVSYGQSKKDLKKQNIKSYTLKEYDYSLGKEKSKIKELISYNKDGNIIEETKYDDNEKIKEHNVIEYDEDGKKTSKTFYFPNGKVKKVNKYTYDGKLKISKSVFDGKGDLKFKEEYIYERFENEDE